jgi:hypothetical protein
MLATELLLALRALDRSEIAAFPHPRLPPLLSETETGTNNPMIPTTRATAPSTRTNRRTVIPRSLPLHFLNETYDAGSLRGGGYERIRLSHRREPA